MSYDLTLTGAGAAYITNSLGAEVRLMRGMSVTVTDVQYAALDPKLRAMFQAAHTSDFPVAQRTPVWVPISMRTHVSRGSGSTNLSSGATNLQEHTITRHVCSCDVTNVRVAFCNAYNTNGSYIANPDPISIRFTIEAPGPYIVPGQFPGGKRDVTLDPGGWAFADVPVTLFKGDVFKIRTRVSVSSIGLKWPQASGETLDSANGEGAVQAAVLSDLTSAGSIAAGTTPGFMPWAIHGLTTKAPSQVWAIVGDSIIAGRGDSTFHPYGAGWPARLFGPSGIPTARVAPLSGGAAGYWYNFSNGLWQRALLKDLYFTHALLPLAANDIALSTLANAQLWAIGTWRTFAVLGVKSYAVTLMPGTTSTDSWATLANQTPLASEASRLGWNAWMRDGAPLNKTTFAAMAAGTTSTSAVRAGQEGHPLAGWLEVADAGESSRNSGKWKVTGAVNYFTADGLHPSTAGHAVVAAAMVIPA